MSKIIQIVEKSQQKKNVPELRIGSSVRVNYKILEGNKARTQAFEGVVIKKHCSKENIKATFTVRKVTQGYGVERIFPLHSPRIEDIKILRIGKVRKAKLYYLRERRGKSARIRERMSSRT